MKNIRIGISLRIDNIKKYDEKRDAISQEWIKLLEECGIIPILIPNSLKNVKKFIHEFNLDGIILSGGDNIGDFPDRDQTEDQLIEYSWVYWLMGIGLINGMIRNQQEGLLNAVLLSFVIGSQKMAQVGQLAKLVVRQKLGDIIFMLLTLVLGHIGFSYTIK